MITHYFNNIAQCRSIGAASSIFIWVCVTLVYKLKQMVCKMATVPLFLCSVSHYCLCQAVNRVSLAAAVLFISAGERKQSSWQLFRSFSLSVVCLSVWRVSSEAAASWRWCKTSHHQLLPGGQLCDICLTESDTVWGFWIEFVCLIRSRFNSHRLHMKGRVWLQQFGITPNPPTGFQLVMMCARLSEEWIGQHNVAIKAPSL